jgi:predicted DNA-binding protein with PD1-like motif
VVAVGRVSAFVVCGIGSLVDARLRFAAQEEATTIPGPSEIVSLSGSLSADGAHLHMSVATPDGTVIGGHVVYGNTIRTTAEVLLVFLPEWHLTREHDPSTGYQELFVRSLGPGKEA